MERKEEQCFALFSIFLYQLKLSSTPTNKNLKSKKQNIEKINKNETEPETQPFSTQNFPEASNTSQYHIYIPFRHLQTAQNFQTLKNGSSLHFPDPSTPKESYSHTSFFFFHSYLSIFLFIIIVFFIFFCFLPTFLFNFSHLPLFFFPLFLLQ